MIEILRIIADSWPIAAMVIGIAAAIVIRRSLREAAQHTARQDEYRASTAVVIRDRE